MTEALLLKRIFDGSSLKNEATIKLFEVTFFLGGGVEILSYLIAPCHGFKG